MIKEYIDKLSEANQEELENLEEQMRDLLDELTYTQEWQDSLQKENNSQTNIFSPRNFDENMEEKLENAQNKVSRLKQQIEYTRELIETHIKKKNEYQLLMDEVQSSEEMKEEDEAFDIDVNQVKKLLNEIYRKSEICLAFLNSNKNRCKTELNEIKNMIRKFAEEVEK